ncbi:hypothetical protein [Methylobacterium organophilum]|uniref:hypothetical protein n=1 Tax=Methylobacterium organophilum TaxID=410 RepID=UPI001EE3A200|nr:hypothetical protein [Methylobacterium organophilum]
MGQRDKQAEEADAIRGEAAFHRSTEKGFAEAVASGQVPAQYSQSFMRGWKKAQGDVAGGQLLQQFDAAYSQWPGKTSSDPQAYDTFVSDFLRQNIKTDDPDILAGLNPRVRQLSENYLHRHIGDASKAATQGLLDAAAAQDSQALEAANTAGLASRRGTDYEAAFRQIEANREAKLKIGANAQDYDQKVVVDGVTAAAIQHRDPKILDFLDRKVPGRDYAWSNTPYGREQRQKTIDTLETMGRRSIADDEKRRREEKAELKDTVTRDTIQAITKDPRAPVPEDLLARGEKVDPDFRINVIRWRDAIAKGGQTSDPEELLAVTSDILNGGGLRRVQRAMDERVFKNQEDLTRAWKLAESMKEHGGKLDAVTKLQSFRDLTATIKKRTATEKDLSATFDDGSFSAEGLQAMSDLRLQVLQWSAENPNAGAIEQEEAVAKFGAALLKRLPQPDAIGKPSYDRQGVEGPNTYEAKPPEESTGNPAVTAVPNPMQPAAPAYGNRDVQVPSGLPGVLEEQSRSPQAPQASTTTATPSPAPQAAQPEAVSAWFNGLTPEQRSRLELKAAEERKPLMLKAQEVYDRGVAAGAIKPPPAAPAPSPGPGKQSSLRAPDGTPIETASAASATNTTDGDDYEGDRQAIAAAFAHALGDTKRRPVGGYVSAQLRDDPQAARILDFVAGPESGGNYNAFFGNGRSTKDLSAMTLDQVMAWSRNRGTQSSATGRYQFMAGTLRGLKEELGLSGSEPFTPALQDRLALQLLERRGYSEWRAGRISDAAFANRLALEWASLPNVTAQNGRPAGVSAYAGDGLNKSLVSPASVLSALRGGGDGPGFLGRLFGRGRRMAPPQRPDNETNV